MPLKLTAPCIAVILSVIALAGCSRVSGKEQVAKTPESAVQQFYEWRLRNPSMALPTEEQLAQMKPYITDELYELLSQAQARAHKASNKSSRKRTFVDGDLFSSVSDGPTSFISGEIENEKGDEHLIAVRLTSAQQLPAVHWIDHVKVIRQDERYVIADVQYVNHWNVGPNQTLVSTLKKQNKRRKV